MLQTTSRDSDSLLQEGGSCYSTKFDTSQSCWQHPKVRENWKMVLAATSLLIIGIGELFFNSFVQSHVSI